jgi:hypothetical protein
MSCRRAEDERERSTGRGVGSAAEAGIARGFASGIGALLLALALGAAAGPAQAAPIAMPAGSTVWMHFEASACPDADGDDCVGSNLPGVAPPNGIPLTTITNTSGQHATGYAEVLPDRVRTLVNGNFTAFLRASFQDTYTVHGAAAGSFPITVTLGASGVGRTLNTGAPPHLNPYRLYVATVGLEIGTFNPADTPISEQFRITPFSPSSSTTHSFPDILGSTFAEVPFSVSTSHTLTVDVGDVFDLAYGINSAFATGEIDLLGSGATISFALPAGVWITSSLGGTWGVVPEPSTLALAALGLAGLAARAQRRG